MVRSAVRLGLSDAASVHLIKCASFFETPDAIGVHVAIVALLHVYV